MSLARYYKSNNFVLETRFQRTLVSRLKNQRRPKPPSCPPSSVEMPVCGPVRRTPLPGSAHSLEPLQREISGSARKDLRGYRNWLERAPGVAFLGGPTPRRQPKQRGNPALCSAVDATRRPHILGFFADANISPEAPHVLGAYTNSLRCPRVGSSSEDLAV